MSLVYYCDHCKKEIVMKAITFEVINDSKDEHHGFSFSNTESQRTLSNWDRFDFCSEKCMVEELAPTFLKQLLTKTPSK